MLHHHK